MIAEIGPGLGMILCANVAVGILFLWDQLGKWEKRWRIRTGRWPYPEDYPKR